MRAGGVAQGVGPEFKPQYCKKKKSVTKQSVQLSSSILMSGERRIQAKCEVIIKFIRKGIYFQ
jgi:hypothetical protein